MPVMALFFPVEVAVALTAVVHFLTNLFKLGLTYRNIHWQIALKFGIPAILAALLGARLLTMTHVDQIVFTWTFSGQTFDVVWIKLILSLLIVLFVLIELLPQFQKITFGRDKLIVGGILSGFFGGLAGFQGALRSMFLIRFQLTKEAFVATGVIIACLIDIPRLVTYSFSISEPVLRESGMVLSLATLSAFVGAFAGNQLLKKVTIIWLQRIVSVCLLLFAGVLGAGII